MKKRKNKISNFSNFARIMLKKISLESPTLADLKYIICFCEELVLDKLWLQIFKRLPISVFITDFHFS